MKDCPNCQESIKQTFKFCPNCKINFKHYKLNNTTTLDHEAEIKEYCSHCDSKLGLSNNFCSQCGTAKTSSNKIDNTVDKVKTSISSISKEFSESETVTDITQNAKKIAKETSKKAKHAGNKILTVLGVLGFVILLTIFVNPFITENGFVIRESYITYIAENRNSYLLFFSAIMGPIILPLIFIYIGFRKNKVIINCLFWPLLVGLTLYTMAFF